MLEESAARYRPVDLARAAGLGPSQIRNYERFGFLPAVDRSPAGHRRYGERHLNALRTARTLIAGYGWLRALDAMRAAHAGEPATAFEVTDERHARLHEQRRQVTQALEALDRTRSRIATLSGLQVYRGRTVGVGEAARAVGVTTSAVRYWESRGVSTAHRVNGRRRFDHRLLQQLQLIKLLRDIDYGFDAIAVVVGDLDTRTGEHAHRALIERRRRIDQASSTAATATAALVAYLDSATP